MSTEVSARAALVDVARGADDGSEEGAPVTRERVTPLGATTATANGRFIPPDELPTDRFLEREISWLQLNERVLELAMDEDIPLFERAKFLAIFSSNLDEFFMIRVAGLKRRIATGIAVRVRLGLEPREVLEKISEVAGQLQRMQADVFLGEVRPRWPRRASPSSGGPT